MTPFKQFHVPGGPTSHRASPTSIPDQSVWDIW